MNEADANLRPLHPPARRLLHGGSAPSEDGLLQRTGLACPLHVSHTPPLHYQTHPLGMRHALTHAHTLEHAHTQVGKGGGRLLSSDRVVSKRSVSRIWQIFPLWIWSLSYPVKVKTHQLLVSPHVVFVSLPIYLCLTLTPPYLPAPVFVI